MPLKPFQLIQTLLPIPRKALELSVVYLQRIFLFKRLVLGFWKVRVEYTEVESSPGCKKAIKPAKFYGFGTFFAEL
jgi:hypothetical protein